MTVRRTSLMLGAVLLALALMSAGATTSLGQADSDQFYEDFSSPTLDPAWAVVQTWPGGFPARAYGYTSPGNRYSLTDNPGFLRFALDPMTHHDGFLNGYLTTYGFHSCCTHDPSLELHRGVSGENWVIETKASYFMPFSNGRDLPLRVYFGDGGAGTIFASFVRWRDGPWPSGTPESYPVYIALNKKLGPSLADAYIWPDSYFESAPVASNPSADTYFYRLERAEGILTASYSYDGLTWVQAWSHDFGSELEGLDQRVVITGHSWFSPAGSYADWDYLSLTPTVKIVEIDIYPGTDPNLVNPNNKGVVAVAILTDDNFDATTVDPLSVQFGPNGAMESHGKGHIEDADGDGDLDIVLHFRTQETGIQCGRTEASLSGKTTDGEDITGSDAIQTEGCE